MSGLSSRQSVVLVQGAFNTCAEGLSPLLIIFGRFNPTPWKMSVCIWKYFGSDNMSYESCEQTGSYDESKLTWKLWKLAVDKPWKHRWNVWLIKMGEKTKYQWGNSRKILWIVLSIVLGATYSPENSLWTFMEKVTSTSEVRWKTFHLNCSSLEVMAVPLHTADTVSAVKMEAFKPSAIEKQHKVNFCLP